MKTNYNYCLTRLLKDEGGYTNNPSDKGGPTNFGITITDYRRYINAHGTAQDVKNMTADQAKGIYKPRYWDSIDGDNLPSGVDYCIFDYGVNSGISRAKKIYNQFKDIKDPVELINKICDERLIFMKNIRNGKDWKVFGEGWQSRVDGVRANSIKLTKGVVPTGSGTVATTAVGGGLVYAYWHLFLNHWVLYSLGLIATAITIDLLIHLYKNRKKTNG